MNKETRDVRDENKNKLSDENLWFRVSVFKTLSINIQILKHTTSSKFVVVSSKDKKPS